ncbi:hypothetical protein BTO00_10880 [Vibrio campbellii]|nr:hypothetical protein BTO00_10880 [Vibrio campbellii]
MKELILHTVTVFMGFFAIMNPIANIPTPFLLLRIHIDYSVDVDFLILSFHLKSKKHIDFAYLNNKNNRLLL